MPDPTLPVIRLQASRRWRFIDLGELWHYRELIYFLTWRDIKVRYKQTAIGIVWAVLQPIAMMAVFTLFFGKLAKLPSDGVPYPVFTFCALLPWQVFSRSVSDSANSLVTDQRLISRVYFPRIIVPTASIVGSLVDFLISFALFLIVMAWYGIVPTFNVVFLPVFLLLMMMTALGMGYWLSALNIEYRDVVYALPFISQIWMFLSPVVYSWRSGAGGVRRRAGGARHRNRPDPGRPHHHGPRPDGTDRGRPAGAGRHRPCLIAP